MLLSFHVHTCVHPVELVTLAPPHSSVFRIKLRRDRSSTVFTCDSMACKSSLTEDDFSCPVCCDVFREPLLLACSHSICKSCLHTFWQQRAALECPICRTVSSTPKPPINIVLRNMCEAVLKERNRRMSVEMEGLCSIHREALTLYCVKDQRPLCTKCKNSSSQSRNSVCSIWEASQDLKVWN